MGCQKDDLEVFDLAVGLELSPVLDALIEYLDGALLASAHHLTPPDEQCGISHSSLLSLIDPRGSPRPYSALGAPGKPRLRQPGGFEHVWIPSGRFADS